MGLIQKQNYFNSVTGAGGRSEELKTTKISLGLGGGGGGGDKNRNFISFPLYYCHVCRAQCAVQRRGLCWERE